MNGPLVRRGQSPDSPEPTCVYQMPFVVSPPSADSVDASFGSFAPQFALVDKRISEHLQGMISLVA